MASLNSLFDIVNTISSYINSNNSFKQIEIESEVSEIKEYPNIVYLTLSESVASVNVKAVIFKSNYLIPLKIGSRIVFQGLVRLYKNEVQILINSYVTTGLGTAINSLNKLKEELALLGYYDNKKEIKSNYSKIGVISSLNAAGLKDFVHTINNRSCGKEIFIYNTTVQGTSAPVEIQKAIALANRHNKAQVLALIRGGGSKEDLECFNDRIIAKAIFESDLPIVTGIGHQIDMSIADLVADKYFITPTATAQGLTTAGIYDNEEIMAELTFISDLFMIKFNSFYEYLEEAEEKLDKYRSKFITDIDTKIIEHTLFEEKIQSYIQNYCDKAFNYFTHVDTNICMFKEQMMKQMTQSLEAHQTLVDIMGPLIESKLSSYDISVSLLGRPIIRSKQSGREIRMMSDLKKGKKYILHFLDGTYEIKLT